jgi:glycosyltransferase involved in cell wall biosynthesis
LEQAVLEFKPDVLLVHTEQAAAVATLVGAATGVPVVVVLHGINTSARLDSEGEHARLRTTLRAATRVVLVGEPLWEHFSRIAGCADTFRIVHNGFRLPPAEDVKPDAPWPSTLRFISVSNLHQGKGIDLNLQAFAQLYREGWRNWTYTIVGAGPEYLTLQALVATLGLGEYVRFTGAVDHAAVYRLLSGAEVFVLPSWREAFGIAWLEAMACGLLAVADLLHTSSMK